MAELVVNDIILGNLDLPNALTSPKPNKPIAGSHNLGSGYNPSMTPANIELAAKHGIAKKVYLSKRDDGKDEAGREVCVCCTLPVDGVSIPLNANLEKLYHLGSGFALYFRFIKFTIALLVLVLCVSGIFNLVTNSKGDDCSEAGNDAALYCNKGYILTYAIPNKRNEPEYLTAQAALNLGVIILILFFFHYLRYQFRKTEVKADDRTITPSDYTIVIEEVPAETTNQEIAQWIYDLAAGENKKVVIEKIERTFNINEYLRLTRERSTILESQKARQNKQKGRRSSSEDAGKLKKREERLKKITELRDEMRNGQREIKKCPIAYVTFTYAKDAAYIQDMFKKPLLSKIFRTFLSTIVTTYDQIKGTRVTVARAPEPSDILWENLGYTSRQRHSKKFATTLVTFILILLSFGIIILVNWAQNQASKAYGKGSATVQGLSIVASVVIVVTNTILTITIDCLTKYEKNLTGTEYLRGMAQKLAVAQFANTALTSLFAELILADGPGVNRVQAMNFYGKGGLIESIFWVFVTNAALGPIMTILEPAYFIKLIQQKLLRRKGKKNTLTQKEANELFEGTAINMPAKFAAMIKIVLMTTFYAPALPFALLITSGGLVLSYWADKYVLLRRNVLPNSLDDELTDAMVEYLEWGACTFAVGNLIYTYTLKNAVGEFSFSSDAMIMAWVGLGISLFHVVFPMEAVNVKLFPIKDDVTEEEPFEKVRLEFVTDYDIENPISGSKARAKFLKMIKEQNMPNAVKSITKGVSLKDEDLQKAITNLKEPVIDFYSLDQYANSVAGDQPGKEENKRRTSMELNRLSSHHEVPQEENEEKPERIEEEAFKGSEQGQIRLDQVTIDVKENKETAAASPEDITSREDSTNLCPDNDGDLYEGLDGRKRATVARVVCPPRNKYE